MWHVKGIPFKQHVYVHPITSTEFCENLQQGGPHNLQLEHFEETLDDPEARLTYCALSGR